MNLHMQKFRRAPAKYRAPTSAGCCRPAAPCACPHPFSSARGRKARDGGGSVSFCESTLLCSKHVMICDVVPFCLSPPSYAILAMHVWAFATDVEVCLRRQLTPPYARGGFADEVDVTQLSLNMTQMLDVAIGTWSESNSGQSVRSPNWGRDPSALL